MLSKLEKYFIIDVPIDSIRCNDLYYYTLEGFGGKDITKWPVYKFFCEYLHGNKDVAHQAFAQWYLEQFEKYADKPKEQGGMYEGSLYCLIEQEFSLSNVDFDLEKIDRKNKLLIEAVQKRVAQRLSLLDSISINGYQKNNKNHIKAVRKAKGIVLKGGHHRCAALRALGYKEVPEVIVYPGMNCFKLVNRIRRMRR